MYISAFTLIIDSKIGTLHTWKKFTALLLHWPQLLKEWSDSELKETEPAPKSPVHVEAVKDSDEETEEKEPPVKTQKYGGSYHHFPFVNDLLMTRHHFPYSSLALIVFPQILTPESYDTKVCTINNAKKIII